MTIKLQKHRQHAGNLWFKSSKRHGCEFHRCWCSWSICGSKIFQKLRNTNLCTLFSFAHKEVFFIEAHGFAPQKNQICIVFRHVQKQILRNWKCWRTSHSCLSFLCYFSEFMTKFKPINSSDLIKSNSASFSIEIRKEKLALKLLMDLCSTEINI